MTELSGYRPPRLSFKLFQQILIALQGDQPCSVLSSLNCADWLLHQLPIHRSVGN
jgi:hypothetical protein